MSMEKAEDTDRFDKSQPQCQWKRQKILTDLMQRTEGDPASWDGAK